MASVSHTATFGLDDSPARMLEDLCCPICGHHDPGDAHTRLTGGELRIFCDCCGAFVTVSVTPEQADALRRWFSE